MNQVADIYDLIGAEDAELDDAYLRDLRRRIRESHVHGGRSERLKLLEIRVRVSREGFDLGNGKEISECLDLKFVLFLSLFVRFCGFDFDERKVTEMKEEPRLPFRELSLSEGREGSTRENARG